MHDVIGPGPHGSLDQRCSAASKARSKTRGGQEKKAAHVKATKQGHAALKRVEAL